MQFVTRKRRGTPTVIIVSLIDVLIVVLIFLMVTTTFKKAAFKVVLPKSNQTKKGAHTEDNEFTIDIPNPKIGPLTFKGDPLTFDKLQQRLKEAGAANTNLTVNIRADTDAPWGLVLKVSEAAHAAHFKVVNASVDSAQAK